VLDQGRPEDVLPCKWFSFGIKTSSLGRAAKVKSIIAIAVFTGIAYQLAKFCQVWITKKEEKQIIKIVEDAWIRFDDFSFIVIIRGPLKLLSYVYDRIFGMEVLSRKAVRRTSILTIGILMMSIAFQSLAKEDVFSFRNVPFMHIDKQIDIIKKVAQDREKMLSESTTEDQKQASKMILEYIDKFMLYDTVPCRIIYLVLFSIIALLLMLVVYSASFAVTRLMLREVIESTSFIIMMSILLMDLFIVLSFGSVILVLLTILSFPICIPLLIFAPILVVKFTTISTFVYLGGAALLWKYGSIMFQTIALISVIPALVLMFFIGAGTILYPIRKAVYKFINRLLLRAAEHDKGLMVFTTTIIGILAGIVALMVRYLM
jgi:hypothetical protein